MKKRLSNTLSTVDEIIELTGTLPEDTQLKGRIKRELIGRLKEIVKLLTGIELFLDELNNCESDDEVEELLGK